MRTAPEFHNESLMPIIMGSPYRVPDYAYPLYGLGRYIDETKALQAYKEEWASGTKAQNDLVTQVTIEAGFGDYNGMLQQAAARVAVAAIEILSLESPVVLDVGAGAGASGIAVARLLPKHIKRNTTMLLNDLAGDKLQVAGQLMEEAEVEYQKLVGSDIEVLRNLEPSSVDILTGVASVHHHARVPFEEYARVLKKGGFAIFADWHHDLWENPARVLEEFLKRFDWPKKEEGLANWVATYPQALNNPDNGLQPTIQDLTAREQITRFWLTEQNTAARANLGPNAIWPLEGHRPVRRYVEGCRQAGLYTDTAAIRLLIRHETIPQNPFQLLRDSSLLQVVIAQLYSLP
ncbi:methyltransferase domain-containing protein [Candidatus Daviesbacteria bacterium]|nr:methyltransferase domain-containing protein [Candidatus Daviesbacteria bacterium]